MNELFRLRIRFAKAGRLRWLSHLELTRAMERLIRRSGLPYAVTQGFNRHMRFAPGPALPVGCAGQRELFDVWLTAYIPAAQALGLLRLAAAETIAILDVQYIAGKARGLQATHTISDYTVELEANRAATGRDNSDGMTASSASSPKIPKLTVSNLQAAMDEFIAQGLLEVMHKGKLKHFDLSTLIIGEPLFEVVADSPDRFRFNCTLLSSESGSLRPEQLVLAVFPEQLSVRTIYRRDLREP
ncbi:MAG: TIGR03936 family radical SAM-associated protein [Coriobacteriales bacterium]|jgi:radical SAM-linked protein|nr:TIGR03936 family radical SAM-associated protein [Coriobacteriales bacterium]